jgi:hypothetical protein
MLAAKNSLSNPALRLNGQRPAFYRRHGAMAAGLLALWLQLLAFTAPMPGMVPEILRGDSGGKAISAQSISALCIADMETGKTAPRGKPALPAGCLQCPLCQTLQVLASGAVPPAAVVAAPIFTPSPLSWPTADAARPPFSSPTGFSSRAPPLV